jgi:hypothetical protein
VSTIDEIKERLLVAPTPFFSVQGAASLAQVKDDGKPAGRAPAAFALMAREAAAETERMTGPVLQRLERDVVILIYAEHLGDRHGGKTADEVEALKAFVRGRLVGWKTSDMDEPITFVGSEVVEARGGGVWFEETFAAPTYLEETT